MFEHKQIWAALEAIAERCGMSLSALSQGAGLDPSSFNPSKRYGPGGRERWPSTETLSKVLKVANMDMKAFAEILEAQAGKPARKPSRRRSKRFPTILEGRIRFEAQASQIPCRIRDLSATGARIRLLESDELPGEFELEIPRLGQFLKVRLVWSQSTTCGVMFLEELRQSSGEDIVGLLEALRTPDDGTYLEVAPERLPPPSQEAPNKRAIRSQKRLKPKSRNSG
jgi:hypothetical protein